MANCPPITSSVAFLSTLYVSQEVNQGCNRSIEAATLYKKVRQSNQSMVLKNMRDPVDDIARQARQGSVAAIIQTLNEQLADVGVRTRAVFAAGVLQLLCEAATKEQLEQSVLIAQIRQILEDIAPRNIRRVK